MSSLSMRVIELFDENKLTFEETEKLLRLISSQTIEKVAKVKFSKSADYSGIYIPPHLPSFLNTQLHENYN